MKQKIILLAIIGLLITSCTNVEFETTVPKNIDIMDEFPKELMGYYLDKENDTLRIERYEFSYGTIGTFGSINGSLKSEEIVLKKIDNYYIFNSKDDTNTWGVIPFTYHKGKLTLYDADIKGDNGEKVADKIKSITQVNETRNIDGEIVNFIINPSNKELRKMFREGVFSEIMIFNKVK